MSWESIETRAAQQADGTAVFCRTLAEMCRAQVPLPRALRLAGTEAPGRRTRAEAEAVAVRVEEGESLHAALEHAPGLLATPYRRAVAAAERAGDLPRALAAIATNAAEAADAGRRIRRAVAGPLGTAVAVLAIGIVTVAWLSPRLFAFTETVSGRTPLPLILGTLAGLGTFTGAVLFFGWVKSGPSGARSLGLPFTAAIRQNAARARAASMLGLLIRQGVPLPEAFALAGAASPNRHLQRAFARMAQAAEEGTGLADALEDAAVFEPGARWLLQTGEASGGVADALDDVAALYSGRFERAVDRFVVLVRPAVELTVGVCVFLLAYAYLAPIYDYMFTEAL